MFMTDDATLVRSLYQVVEAQGRPLRVGGQPSHRDSRGDSGWSQDDSPNTRGEARARQNTSTNIVILCVMLYRKDNVNEIDLDPYHPYIVLLRCLNSKGCLIVKLCVILYRKDNVNKTDLDPNHHNIVIRRL